MAVGYVGLVGVGEGEAIYMGWGGRLVVEVVKRMDLGPAMGRKSEAVASKGLGFVGSHRRSDRVITTGGRGKWLSGFIKSWEN